MRELVRKEWKRGALGIGSRSFIRRHFMRKTEELIELCKVAAKYQGKYISHMRSEGNNCSKVSNEVIRINREAGIPGGGFTTSSRRQKNWPKEDELLERIEAAKKEGLKIRANMYTYTAAGTGTRRLPAALDGGWRLPAIVQTIARSGHAGEKSWPSANRF